MKSVRFNKSQIMKRAHNCYRKHSATMTFSQCLKWSWKKAVEELKQSNYASWVIYTSDKRKGFNRSFREKMNRAYKGVTFGRNDWAVSYGRAYAHLW